MFTVVTDDTESYCIKHDYLIESCSGSQQEEISFTCKVDEPQGYQMTTAMTIFRESKSNIWNISILFFLPFYCLSGDINWLFNSEGIVCENEQYGSGRVEDVSRIGCDEGQEGNKTALCQATGEWKLIEDTCIIIEIKELLIDSVVGDLLGLTRNQH